MHIVVYRDAESKDFSSDFRFPQLARGRNDDSDFVNIKTKKNCSMLCKNETFDIFKMLIVGTFNLISQTPKPQKLPWSRIRLCIPVYI